MAEKQRRRPLLAFCIATGVFFAIVTIAGLLGLPGSWMALLIFGGLPFLFAFAAIIGLRATDSRMAKAGPGVLSALGPGEIREVPVAAESTTRLGWRAAVSNLPRLLPPRRRWALAAIVAAGAAAGAALSGAFVEDIDDPFRRAVSITLFALCGALASAVLPLAIWMWLAHRASPLPRETRQMLENSINPANDRVRLNLSRVDEIERAIDQRRTVIPLVLPLALCISGAAAMACLAELVLTNGQSFPRLASFVWTSLMLLLPLTGLGFTEQLARALDQVRADEDEYRAAEPADRSDRT
ncbi:hypothetical protein HDC34_000506 [Pseudoclavibacter sp. JAI123]|uniref:hypothetical protein n=1 Tax=Pseudoclavibacter sp. JAI123 TaxID=2723065 RepID=UPI0015C81B0D|nr:hypothetical protein [Pseudoclavibacter sp. JAI123]NYF12212.1 hypothetical protein [Pseudoclavibacter sp. JAI123]